MSAPIASLSPAQEIALRELAKAAPAAIYTSNRNGSGYVAYGSAKALERRGFAKITLSRRFLTCAEITKDGLAYIRIKEAL